MTLFRGVFLASVGTVDGNALEESCSLLLERGDGSSALLAGMINAWRSGQRLGRIGVPDMEAAAVTALVGQY